MAKVESWLNIDLSNLTSNDKNDIVTELKVNGYRNFLQQKLMPTDSATRLSNFETTLNNILTQLPNYSFPISMDKILGVGFVKIRRLCNGKEGMSYDLIDTKINQELSLIENNVKILNLLENKNCLLLRTYIVNTCGLSNAYYFCNHIEYNGKKLTDLLTDNSIPSLSHIDATLENIARETNAVLKNRAKERMMTVIEKYLNSNLPELHHNFQTEIQSSHIQTSIGGFSVELTLKLLYSLCKIDEIIDGNYLQILESDNENVIVDEILDPNWMTIADKNNPNSPNKLRDLENLKRTISSSILPSGINGHTLFSSLDDITTEEIKSFIKYKIMTISSVLETRLLNINNPEEYVTAEDLMLLLRDFDDQSAVEQFKNIEANIFVNSNVFDGKRYNLNDLKDENLRFIIAFSYATYIALNHEYNRQKNPNNKVNVPTDFNIFEKLYSEKLNELINNNSQKREVLLELCNNLSSDNQQKIIKYLNQTSFYELIKYFSYNEIKELLSTVTNSNPLKEEENFKDVVYYAVFLKTYINEISLNLDSKKFARINKLFETIRATNNFTLLGYQFTDWFYSIRIEELTPEEFEIIDKIDPRYVSNCLNYRNKIIYEKCKNKNIKFSYLYEMYISVFDIVLEIFDNKFEGKIISEKYLRIVYELKSILSDDLFKTVLNILKENDIRTTTKKLKKIPLNEEIKKALFHLKGTNYLVDEYIENVASSSDRFDTSSWHDFVNSYHLEKAEDSIKANENTNNLDFWTIQGLIYSIPPQQLETIQDLMSKTGFSIKQIEIFCTLYKTNEEIENIALWLKNAGLSPEQIATKCGSILSRATEYNIPSYLEFKQEEVPTNLSEKTINQINNIPNLVKKIELSMWSIIELYRFELTNEQIESIPELSRKTGLSRIEIKKLICELEGNYQQATELCDLLDKQVFKADLKMKINNLEDLVKNIKLGGYVGDYIFYITPQELENLISICNNHSIPINIELLLNPNYQQVLMMLQEQTISSETSVLGNNNSNQPKKR